MTIKPHDPLSNDVNQQLHDHDEIPTTISAGDPKLLEYEEQQDMLSTLDSDNKKALEEWLTSYHWFASIGELDKWTEFEAGNLREAQAKTLQWIYSLNGRPAYNVRTWFGTTEPERIRTAAWIPATEHAIRRLSWLRRILGFSRYVTIETKRLYNIDLSIIHDEINETERDELCRKVGLYAQNSEAEVR